MRVIEEEIIAICIGAVRSDFAFICLKLVQVSLSITKSVKFAVYFVTLKFS